MFTLLTGASGFIGRNILEQLHIDHTLLCTYRKEKPEYFKNKCLAVYCNLEHEDEVKQLFERYPIDTILHFAANPLTRFNKDKPNELIDSNIKVTNNLLAFCKSETKFILASSILVYGDCTHKITEEVDICQPTSIYGTTKLACENLLNFYVQEKGIHDIVLRMSATVGKYSTHGLLHDLIYKIQTQDELHLIGKHPGSQKPFTHVDDVILAVRHALQSRPTTFNVCPNDNMTVFEVANELATYLNIQKRVVWTNSSWTGDNNFLLCNGSYFQNLQPKYTTSKEAVRAAINDIFNN